MSFVNKVSGRRNYESGEELKISFCTSCKGRLHHLKETLPQNLEVTKSYPNSEIVILAYGDDETASWVKENYSREIQEGRIRLASIREEDAPYFKMAHAKNVVHRLATGDILCNLDADNILAEGFAEWLNREFSRNANVFIHPGPMTLLAQKIADEDGVGGRIAVSSQCFSQLQGYNEQEHNKWGGDDYDIMYRAKKLGMEVVNLPRKMVGKVLGHDDELRVSNMSPDDQEDSLRQLAKPEGIRSRVKQVKNALSYRPDEGETADIQINRDGNYGCADVIITQSDLTDKPERLGPAPVELKTLVSVTSHQK